VIRVQLHKQNSTKNTKEGRTSDRERQSEYIQYVKADLEELVAGLEHPDEEEKLQLLPVLQEHEAAFAGTWGKWDGKPIELELKEGYKPYYGKPYQIPQAYRELVKKEDCSELKLSLTNKTKAKAFSEVKFNKLSLWTYSTEGKEALIFSPLSLREELMAWYHSCLHHPGVERTSLTVRQFFD